MSPSRLLVAQAVRPARQLALAAVLAAPIVLLCASLSGSLHSLYFPTGWLTAGGLAVFAFDWWKPVRDSDDLARRLNGHLALGALLAVCFALHVDYRVPNGVIDVSLTIGFALLLVSLAIGVGMVRLGARRTGRRALQWWLNIHSGLSFSLLAMTCVHAVLVHCHGAIAYVMLGKRA